MYPCWHLGGQRVSCKKLSFQDTAKYDLCLNSEAFEALSVSQLVNFAHVSFTYGLPHFNISSALVAGLLCLIYSLESKI